MISEKKKIEILEKILESQEFKNSKSYKELLKYLVNASISGEKPTEHSIASEGLSKEENFDTAIDASVRVYIHNLRKKLADYYLNEGKNDEVKISIPKGYHYEVIFSIVNPNEKNIHKHRNLIYTLLGILTVSIVFNIIQVHNKSEDGVVEGNSLVWGNSITNSFPTLLVFGDYFLIKDTLTPSVKYIRDFRVNNEKEFNEMKENGEFIDKKYTTTELTFLGKSSLWSLHSMLTAFRNSRKSFEVKLASELTWEDLNNFNIIFAGNFKTLRIMNNFLTNSNSKYQIYPNALIYKDPETKEKFSYHAPKNLKTGYVEDYALVAKLPGPNHNSVIIFSSTHDVGLMATVHSFVKKDFLDQLTAKLSSKVPDIKYFEAIFEVQGFERTPFNPKLLHFNKVGSDYKIGNVESINN